MSLSQSLALVSGGTSGLGLATVQAFLREGATVIVAARSRKKFQQNLGEPNQRLHFIPTDFADMRAVRALHQQVAEQYGRLDIAINNVGTGIVKPLVDCEEADFDQVMNVNLKSLWLSLKLQIPLMLEAQDRPKHIVNLSSINGLGGAEGVSLYAAAKAGVISLTKSAALETARSNLSINAVVPGPFQTPMLTAALDAQVGGDAPQRAALETQYQQMIPRGRFGHPAELAEAVLWLCQGKCPFLSGHSLILDGGMSSRFR